MGTVQGSVEEGLEGMVQQGEDKGSGPFVENTRTRCLSFQNENFLGISGCLPTQGKREFYHKVPATRRGVRNKFCLLEWHGNSPRSCKKWTLSGHSRSVLHSRGSACRTHSHLPLLLLTLQGSAKCLCEHWEICWCCLMKSHHHVVVNTVCWGTTLA